MWIMTAYLCQNFSSSRVRIFSTIRLFWALGPLFGLLVGRYIVGYVGLTPETAYPCMMIAVFAALIGMTCVFNENVMADVMAIMPIEKRERFREKCRAVAEKYQLSNREAEIMTFFAKGRNLAYIQEELNISKSTVSSHRQHIYQKLNIHSQQELLDVIQATDPS
jgi:DNA-binding NarL/FixJ family response regulator